VEKQGKPPHSGGWEPDDDAADETDEPADDSVSLHAAGEEDEDEAIARATAMFCTRATREATTIMPARAQAAATTKAPVRAIQPAKTKEAARAR